jgi:putative SOS response-associated peptidase YedK
MCSRYCLTLPEEAVRQMFGTLPAHPFPPRYNIAPTQPVAIVRQTPRYARELALVRWGLLPPWVKDPREFATLINARAETAAEKPSFRGALRHRRCLIPATGYYEWAGKKGAKVPYLLRPRRGGLVAMAGLWEHWIGADGSEVETMAVLTVPALDAAAAVHDRMPLLLGPEAFERWLDCRPGTAVGIEDLLCARESDLDASPVARAVNDPTREGAELWVTADDLPG